MIYSTATVPVNPDGEIPLTRTQIWAGLELKARDARLSTASAVHALRCHCGKRHPLRPRRYDRRNRPSRSSMLEPDDKVTFFQATGPREGGIVDEIYEDDHGALQLRF